MARIKPRVRISGRARLAGTAKLPMEGRYTATETGAKEAAEIKHLYQEQRDVLNMAQSTKGFENKIRGKKGY